MELLQVIPTLDPVQTSYAQVRPGDYFVDPAFPKMFGHKVLKNERPDNHPGMVLLHLDRSAGVAAAGSAPVLVLRKAVIVR